MTTKNLQLDEGAHKKLALLADYTGITMKEIAERLIAQSFTATFGDVDPASVTIERHAVVAGEGE